MLHKLASGYTKVASRVGIALVAVGMAVFSFVGTATAADQPQTGLAVSPHTFEMSANPGDTLKNSVRVDNLVDIPLEVTVHVRNFSALGEDGAVNLSTEEDEFSLSTWTSVTPAKIIIPARESKTFDYAIAIPQNAAPGGRFGSIVFQTAPTTELGGGSGFAVSQEIGALVFVKIAGEVTEKASITDFKTIHGINNFGPVDFDIRVKNEGNVHFKPTGTITISDFMGQKVATIPVDSQNVLPGAIRRMSANWNSGWLFGQYTATISLVYGKDRQVITASTAFWGFPYVLVGISLLVIGILGWALYPRRARIWRAIKILFGKE